MAGKKPLLSWLFGPGPEEEPKKEQTLSQLQEEAAPPAPVPKPEADPFRLGLAPDHAINKLSRLWREQTGWQAAPRFRFEEPDGADVIPAGQAKQELARLLLTVNASANQRLNKVVPKGKGAPKKGEEPVLPNLDAQAVAFVSNDRLTAWVFG